MFDFHIHSTVSFDGKSTPEEMVRAAESAGLKEICFTDHIDFNPGLTDQYMIFDTENYKRTYANVKSDRLSVHFGLEFGMLPYNRKQFEEDIKRYPFDFVIGSVHYADDLDVYEAPYWADKDRKAGEKRYFENVLACVETHDHFDVLGHLTYITKVKNHPTHMPVPYEENKEIIDQILLTLAKKEKGMEVNTSGKDRCGSFLPEAAYLRRFRELGGRVVTVGSDAHDEKRVGQYSAEAMQMCREIFGYVCTFEKRDPVFHKL